MTPSALARALLMSTAIGVALLLSCGENSSTAGNGSQTPNAAVGTVYDFDHTPAAGATVEFVPVEADPRQPGSIAGTVATDQSGHYSVNDLPAGHYNVLAHKADRRALVDSVGVDSVGTTTVPDATLGAVGSLSGVVKLVGNPQNASVFLLVLGSTSYAVADSSGRFALDDLAGGAYHVLILTTVTGYGPVDTLLPVRSGFADTLFDTIWINTSTVPAPTGLSATYDTASGTAHLRWHATPYPGLQGYLVYRYDCSATVPQLVSGQAALADTTWSDTIFRVTPDTLWRCAQYRVRVQDQNALMGSFSAPVRVVAASPGWVRTSVVLSMPDHEWSGHDTFTVPDTLLLVGCFNNPTRSVARLSWYLGNDTVALRTTRPGLRSGTDTAKLALSIAGATIVRLRAFDDGGGVWQDTVCFAVSPWRVTDTMPGKAVAMAAAVVIDQKAYLIGGTWAPVDSNMVSVWEYDVSTGTWTGRAPMPTARLNATAAVVAGRAYVIGGEGADCRMTNAVEEFDPQSNTWTPRAPLPVVRSNVYAAAVGNRVWVFGVTPRIDTLGPQPSSSVTLVYDPSTDQWDTAAPMPIELSAFALSPVGSTVYIAGGGTPTDYTARAALAYNTQTGTWDQLPAPPPGFGSSSAAAVDGNVYFFGQTTTFEYSPASNSWARKSPVRPAPCCYGVTAVAAGSAVVAFTYMAEVDAATGPRTIALQYYPATER
jgi:N-acetylneuraminic acid mutarotase